MKKIFSFVLLIVAMIMFAPTCYGEVKFDNNTYTSSSTGGHKSKIIDTPYKYKDSKNVEYPIYLSENGCAFIKKVSAKTNKEYRSYLGKEISIDICTKMGIEYKGKK